MSCIPLAAGNLGSKAALAQTSVCVSDAYEQDDQTLGGEARYREGQSAQGLWYTLLLTFKCRVTTQWLRLRPLPNSTTPSSSALVRVAASPPMSSPRQGPNA